ncbi:Cyclin-D3-2 like [Actinidia chinensis var. chinensis]|uniref:Cyclin-D3-2 like n=1 Tax=Actinidia chinensis var. chinensis TaxID=1590841 RepID=A0A2R6R5H4_ACTCC|nr:Cyclin-D3-2 like [Actinidia chinensis var. chinensis]
MTSFLSKETQPKNPLFTLDGLYCEDEDLGDYGLRERSETCNENMYWEDDEVVCLLSKEREASFGQSDLDSNGSFMVARTEAIEWMLRVIAHYDFTFMTTLLAVNYFDRFKSSLCLHREKPWMSQLAAVACLSLAAKVEETQVPLLLDLQVEESKYVFEAKTIQRMELLVLSTLGWKMNPVTPLSFIDHIRRRLGFKTHLYSEFLRRCERLLLSLITDSRFGCYLLSVLAAATMLHVIKEFEPYNVLDYETELLDILKISRDKLDDLNELILELSSNHGHNQSQTRKRKYQSTLGSPNGVVDAYFSSDSSNDSWALASSVSSSLEPMSKKSRVKTSR